MYKICARKIQLKYPSPKSILPKIDLYCDWLKDDPFSRDWLLDKQFLVQISVRPKFGIGYGIGRKYRYRYLSRNFFAKTEMFFFKFYYFFSYFLGEYNFL